MVFFGVRVLLEDDSAAGSVDVATDIGPSVKEAAKSQMDAAVVALSRELAKLRTGRASAGWFCRTRCDRLFPRLALFLVVDYYRVMVLPRDARSHYSGDQWREDASE